MDAMTNLEAKRLSEAGGRPATFHNRRLSLSSSLGVKTTIGRQQKAQKDSEIMFSSEIKVLTCYFVII